jgi:PEP-CTERM motif
MREVFIMRSKITLLTLVLLFATSAFAGITFTAYSSYPTWSAATAGWSHYPFLGVPVNQSQNPGTSFLSSAGSFGPPRGVFVGTYNQVWTDRVTQQFNETTTWWITGLDLQAFGGYWDFSPGGHGQGLTLTIALLGPGSQHVFDICGDPACNVPGQSYYVPDGTWFGVVGDAPFTSMTITADHQPGSAETFDLAGLDLARVPEPGSLMLLGTGILGLAGAVRRKLML